MTGVSMALCGSDGCGKKLARMDHSEIWERHVPCLNTAIEFSYARNLYMFLPLTLYCWMLYRIHTRRAVLKHAEQQLQVRASCFFASTCVCVCAVCAVCPQLIKRAALCL